jgi:Flp pilus assembly protein TadB
MIAAAVIACAVCAIVLALAYVAQSERVHTRQETARKRSEIDAAEKDLKDALESHNLARIAAARDHLHRVRGE